MAGSCQAVQVSAAGSKATANRFGPRASSLNALTVEVSCFCRTTASYIRELRPLVSTDVQGDAVAQLPRIGDLVGAVGAGRAVLLRLVQRAHAGIAPCPTPVELGQHFLGGKQYNNYPVDTLMAISLPGHLTFFSDLRHIPLDAIHRARPWLDFYRTNRDHFTQMTYPLLADPIEKQWTALQTWNPETASGALLSFRQQSDAATQTIALRNVPPGMTFELRRAPTGEVAFLDMANGTFLSLRDTLTGYGRPSGYASLADARRAATLLTAAAGENAFSDHGSQRQSRIARRRGMRSALLLHPICAVEESFQIQADQGGRNHAKVGQRGETSTHAFVRGKDLSEVVLSGKRLE